MVPQTEEPPPEVHHVGDDDRPWCCRCGTNEYLCFESITPVPYVLDVVDADYVCTKCEGFYGHLVPIAMMNKGVLRVFGIPCMIATAEGYLHFGEVMTPAGERMPTLHARLGLTMTRGNFPGVPRCR